MVDAYAPICLQSVYAPISWGIGLPVKILCLTVFGVFAAIFVVAAIKSPSPQHFQALWMAMCVAPLSIAGFVWWSNFFRSVLMQSSAVWMQLTPQLRVRMRRALFGMWFLITLVLSAALSVALGRFAMCFWMVGLFLVALVVMAIWPKLSWLFCLVLTWKTVVGVFGLTALELRVAALNLTLLSAAATVIFGGAVLWQLFSVTGLRLAGAKSARFPVVALVQDAFLMQKKMLAKSSALYRWALRTDSRNASNTGALLMHVLGSSAHASAWLYRLPLAWLALAFIPFFRPSIIVLCMLPMLVWTSTTISLMYMLVAATRSEQALLRLAPLMPRGRALNRLLAARLLRYFLLAWLLSSAFAVSLTASCGTDSAESLAVLWRCTAFLLPAGFILADYAGEYERYATLKMLGSWILGLLLIGLFAWTGWPWACLGLLSVAASAALVWRRWPAMLAAPVAFPACRNVGSAARR